MIMLASPGLDGISVKFLEPAVLAEEATDSSVRCQVNVGIQEIQWKRFVLIVIIVVPMTVVTPVPVPVRIIVVIILAIVARIIAPVVHRIRVAISGPDIYIKVPVRLRSLGQESDKPKR